MVAPAVVDAPHYVVDLRSDTVSQPTQEMREAMATAVVGDDVYHEDPTVIELERRAAELFGKEAGLFVPSGTMGNLLAIMVHCPRRGSEAIVGDLSHTFLYEQAGAAHLGGVQLATVKNEIDGTFNLDAVHRKIRYNDCHEPTTSLVIVENTHNMCGGKVVPLKWLDDLAELVRAPGVSHSPIALHMDGARVFNAAEALGVPVSRIARDMDSICFCLSKGLSAPVGSLLVGSKAFIKAAHRLRKAVGGGMRQVGILAAAGLVALETIVPLLGLDHQRTKHIANALHELQSPNIKVDLPNVHSNILLIHCVNPKLSAKSFAERLKSCTDEEQVAGIVSKVDGRSIRLLVSSRDWEYARIVLYHQITDEDVALAIKKFQYVVREFDRKLA